MAVNRWTIAFGFGAVLLVAAALAATWNITIFYEEGGQGGISGFWNCGSVINPIEDHESVNTVFHPQATCAEQVGTYRLVTVVPLGLGILTLMYGTRLKRMAAREPDRPQDVSTGHT